MVTFQHANGWRFGDNFLFFDTAMPHGGKADYYGEYYGNLSLGKITGVDLSIGPIKDVGVLMGINWAPGSDVLQIFAGYAHCLESAWIRVSELGFYGLY